MDALKSLPSLWVGIATMHRRTAKRTLTTFLKRSQETQQFLTIDLPNLGKDVDRSLSSGRLVVTAPFKLKKGSSLPVFMHEFFCDLYDHDGTLRNTTHLRFVRQLLFMFYKLNLPFSPEQELEAYKKFIELDGSVKTDFTVEQYEALKPFIASAIPESVTDIWCHHSSGATADGFDNIQKRTILRYIPELFEMYNANYFVQNRDQLLEFVKQPYQRSFHSKVTLVPKDSRGPRIICMEPHERMFVQKGLQCLLYDHIEDKHLSLASSQINFTDQTVNRELAYKGSLDGSLATIDLKDASDLVSWELVKNVFPDEWVAALAATRSPTASVNSDVIDLKKFAPMGSALCFPIEALIFWSIARTVTSSVWVYGDDIIVPQCYAQDTIMKLEQYGLRVNRDKTLLTGFFRESCGAEYYRGHDISIVKLRQLDLESFAEFCNNMHDTHGHDFSEVCISWYESINQGHVFMRRHPDTPQNEFITVKSYRLASNDVFFKRRWSKDLQRWEYRALANVPRTSKRKLDGYTGLFDWFNGSTRTVRPNEDRLTKRLLAGLPTNEPYHIYRTIKNYVYGGTRTGFSLNKNKILYRWGTICPVYTNVNVFYNTNTKE